MFALWFVTAIYSSLLFLALALGTATGPAWSIPACLACLLVSLIKAGNR